MSALLDSGCDVSVCSRRLIPNALLEPTSRTLYTADGTSIPLLGETIVNFRIRGLPVSAKVAVTDAINELILGIDWLTQNNCKWDFEQSKFTINNITVKTLARRPDQSIRRLIVQEDAIIPA